jgi:hypothetical protein
MLYDFTWLVLDYYVLCVITILTKWLWDLFVVTQVTVQTPLPPSRRVIFSSLQEQDPLNDFTSSSIIRTDSVEKLLL